MKRGSQRDRGAHGAPAGQRPVALAAPVAATLAARLARVVALVLAVVVGLVVGLLAVPGGAAASAQRTPRTAGESPAETSLTSVTSVIAVTTLPAPAVALAPYRGGVAALGADGSLVHATRPGDARRVRRGLVSEVLIACEGGLLAVDGSGRLTEIASGADGPAVSLHATPLCLPGGRVLALDPNAERLMLLDASLRQQVRAPLAALPDAEPVFVGPGAVAIPVHPSLEYRHGVLGDEVEAAAVAVVSLATLETVARWDVPGRRVIEQRRLVPFPAAGRLGMVATVSGGGDGGALVVLAAGSDTGAGDTAASDATELTVVATGPGIGVENRWRHVLGASGRRLYALATPHLGGPLERWTLPATSGGGTDLALGDARDGAPAQLRREAFSLGVTSHTIGQRELDLGRLVPRAPGDPATLDLLAMPSRDLRTLRLIACDESGCRASADAPLGGRLAAAPWVERDEEGDVRAWIATDDASLLLVTFPRDGILSEPE